MVILMQNTSWKIDCFKQDFNYLMQKYGIQVSKSLAKYLFECQNLGRCELFDVLKSFF